jgi:uncharacterized protein YjbI with pentapeptide repeats
MANEKHLDIIKQGVQFWNSWRAENPEITPDLGGVNLSKASLRGVNFSGVDLSDASFYLADLSGAQLSEANLRNSDLGCAILCNADLRRADIRWANISESDLSGANLNGANLAGSNLSESNFNNADLTGCHVYAISAWNLKMDENTKQSNLLISKPDETTITVDDIEVAQFIYLLLNRSKLRNVLDTMTSKAVLLLGRFTPERKQVLDGLAGELRKNNLLPIIFDFERSTNRDFTETIKILAGLSLFVIVDITKPKSAPQELTAIVPDYQIPFVPIIEEGEDPYSMFVDFQKYEWVLKPIIQYPSKEMLFENFKDLIMDRAWKKHLELQRKKTEKFETMSISEMIKMKEKSAIADRER